MKLLYKFLRFIFVSLLLVVPVAAVMLYVVLSIPGVQRGIRNIAQRELTELLGSRVEIGKVQIAPFNRLTVSDAVVLDSAGVEALTVGHLGAGISLTDLILHGRVVVSYTELVDFHLTLYRDSASSPLNIEPIIRRLKGKDGGKKRNFELAVNTVVIRRGSMDYDVKSAPDGDASRFDRNHISLRGFRADVTIPEISNESVEVEVKRFAVEEKSGAAISNMRFNFRTDHSGTSITDFRLDSGSSRLLLSTVSSNIPLLDIKNFDVQAADVEVATLPGTVIRPSDFASFLPQLAGLNRDIELALEVDGRIDDLRIKRLSVDARDGALSLNTSGSVYDITSGACGMHVELDRINLAAAPDFTTAVIGAFTDLSEGNRLMLERAGTVDMLGRLSLTPRPLSAGFDGSVSCEAGVVDIVADYAESEGSNVKTVDGTISTRDLSPDVLLASRSLFLTHVSGTVEGNVAVAGLDTEGNVEAAFSNIGINGHEISGLKVEARMAAARISANVVSTDVDFATRMSADCDLSGELPAVKLVGQFDNIDLSAFIPGGLLASTTCGLTLVADLSGNSPDNLEGVVKLSDIYMADAGRGRRVHLDLLAASLERADSMASLNVNGDFIQGNVTGELSLSAVAPAVKNIFSSLYPALAPAIPESMNTESQGALGFGFTLNPDSALYRYFKIPVELIDAAHIWGALDNTGRKINFNLEAPYLWQKGKLIEKTSVTAVLDADDGRSSLKASAIMPSKYGPMTLSVNSEGGINSLLTGINWHIDAQSTYDGTLRVSTSVYRDSIHNEHQLCSQIDVLDSRIVFNDTVWHVDPSRISLTPGRIEVDNFHIGRLGQELSVNGIVTPDSTDVLTVKLRNIDLGYVFETLGINHVTFGGIATGDFYASQLFKDSRRMFTPMLSVKDFSYNGSRLGDAMIRSRWVPETQGISIYADITGEDGRHSTVDGEIRPVASELDFAIDASRLPVGFLTPFMDAFASDVTGYASGNARLFGTFHDINLSGELLAEDFSLLIKFTNTAYTVARDSVHIVPGRIGFDNLVLHDRYGKTALLSGELTHDNFHDASFRFDVTDAHDLLCYDISERMTTDPWFGRVFGTGGVTLRGIPGMINIGVNIATAPHTSFTLKLDDSESAEEYDFITFHDRDKARKDSIAALDPLPLIIRDLRNRRIQEEDGPPTEYVLDFNLDVTPAATLNIIMDPSSGDKISAVGEGHMRMNYASTGDFRIFGNYRINRGSYNFTLQDIIIKDFALTDGSMIKFNGNPDAALLDLKATYTVNANLTDLDESFSQDKELNRTNVPVNAVLLVTGDMRQPDIAFDLEFPTLTRDVDRKVRSIVSTEEMMNRQIIYLLALNRFYTPDYMNATRGNELVSVASSTISSQLSSMLGQLSDKWSIAPNFRSDRGDFSDVEVDVALSSHLLNNRLLLNGNFGYRDKSLNNNSFIGDFDIRYLLNRTGTISLKAYNRYNDQNYYLKSALTTQGIGVVFKRDFDNWREFLKPFRRKAAAKVEEPQEAGQKEEPSDTSDDSDSADKN
ncbi:MAG: translocation/assembly module TamB [Duncaniella sp.]|nr:translocation/assembly module TamB [Duncaniella sp.]